MVVDLADIVVVALVLVACIQVLLALVVMQGLF